MFLFRRLFDAKFLHGANRHKRHSLLTLRVCFHFLDIQCRLGVVKFVPALMEIALVVHFDIADAFHEAAAYTTVLKAHGGALVAVVSVHFTHVGHWLLAPVFDLLATSFSL